MDSIRIKNLRSLVDTGDIKLKGLTVFVGENSCGKSTLLRTFPLIKQSLEEDTTTPILWFGKYVDYGDFEKSVNKESNNEIVFEFNFINELESNGRDDTIFPPMFRYYYARNIFGEKPNLKYTMHLNKYKDKDFINKFTFEIDSNIITINMDVNSNIKNIFVNDIDYSAFCNRLYIRKSKDNIVPIIMIKPDKQKDEDYNIDKMDFINFHRISNPFANEMISCLKGILHSNTNIHRIMYIINNFTIGDKEKLLSKLKRKKGSLKTWEKFLNNVDVNDVFSQFSNLVNLNICLNISEICQLFSETVNIYFNNVHYIAPIRANAERYYRIQNLSRDAVDFQGRNLPMLLKSFKKGEEEKFKNWLNNNFGFSVEANSYGDHLSIDVIKNGERTNMADTGFGYSQVIPIIVQLWLMTQKNIKNMTLLIEQPELHLHPKLQATLIDTFVNCVNTAKKEKIDLKIVVETHSETILNRIGYLIYKNKIDKESTNIYLFDKINNKRTEVKESFFNDQGYLKNWPSGFFEPEEEE